MSKTLLSKFKDTYLNEFKDKEISWTNLDKDGNLTVGIRCKVSKEEKFYLNVREYPNGDIYWY